MLVAAGVDVTPIGAGHRTALHTAADYGPDDPALAGLLLGAGCDPAVVTITINYTINLIDFNLS